MANTVIQIKRSTVTTAPTAGSLSAAEPAYSYLSDKLFIGSSDGSQVIEIGGRYYVDTAVRADQTANAANLIAIAAFEKANSGDSAAITAAYDKANSANLLAYNTGIGANAYATSIGTASNSYLLAVIAGANSAVGAGANAFASATIAGANSAVGAGANAFASSIVNSSGTGANNYANSTFVKLVAANQTITGNLAVTGSLTISGNAFSIDTETLRVSDPLIYLAGNNYTSDIVDIGFVGNYNTGSANLHTGIFRDATVKEYFVFDSYNQEPNPNHIDTSANGFSLAVLNATIKTSNLILGGANAILTIAGVGTAANAFAAATIAGANTAVGAGANAYATAATTGANNFMLTVQNGANTAVGAGANAFAAATIAGANTAVGAGANNYLLAVIAGANTAVGAGANNYLIPIINAANTNASNGTYITTGVVGVSVGGTGRTTFANNGILFGNNTSGIRVTAAGTEGNVLQVNAQGTPLFGMLDGGTF